MATPSARWSRSRIGSPKGGSQQDFSDVRGLAYLAQRGAGGLDGSACRRSRLRRRGSREWAENVVIRLPAYEQVVADAEAYARASRVLHRESNPGNARPLVQRHGDRDVWLTAPPIPLTTPEMDAVYDLPYRARAASVLRGRENPRLGDDPPFRDHHARLFRRLLLLLDHRA